MVVLEQVFKTYRGRRGEVGALDGVDLRIEEGEFVLMCGPSGSGKTTVLMTVAAMLRPTRGTVTVLGRRVYDMSMQDRARFRAEHVGFVFQMFHLVPYLNVIENIVLAGGAGGGNGGSVEALRLAEHLGLGPRAFHRPGELSAGEKQRAAIARAMFNRPKLVLADEPTGNLDPENAAVVLGYLSEFHSGGGTVILATHGSEAEEYADRVIRLRAGRVASSQED